jgi:hypothetical protein
MLRDWVVQALHRSFHSITMLGGGLFEIKFQEEVGKIHVLLYQYQVHNHEIVFSTWKPNLDLDGHSQDLNKRVVLLWIQIMGLPPMW